MSPKNDTKVLIGGNVYTLAGDESEEYIQRVALYINNKLDKLKASDNGQLMNTRMMSILLAINIADDYFKAKDAVVELESILTDKNNKIIELEKNIINISAKLRTSDNKNRELQNKVNTYKAELDEYIDTFEAKEE